MKIKLRPLEPASDYPQLVQLLNTDEREPLTVSLMQEGDRQSVDFPVRRRMVALDASGQIVGFTAVSRIPWAKPGQFQIRIITDPTVRGQGLGVQLYHDCVQFSGQQNVTQFRTQVLDDSPESVRFAEKRGFYVDRHLFESVLDLASFDETPFAGICHAAEQAGFRFASLAELGDCEEARLGVFALFDRTNDDDPSSDGTRVPWENFRKVFESHWYRADGLVVALKEGTTVAVSWVGYNEHNQSMFNAGTAVDREFRGHKLALATKLLAIHCAKRYGAKHIRTNNDSKNAPMLSINRKLGYQPHPGKYIMLMDTSPEA